MADEQKDLPPAAAAGNAAASGDAQQQSPNSSGKQPGAAEVNEELPAEPGARFTIFAPRANKHQMKYSGSHPLGVRFFDGVASTDDEAIANEFKSLGWRVTGK